MKNIFKYNVNKLMALCLTAFTLLLSFSCSDDDKDNLNDFLETGGFPRFEVTPPAAVGVNQVSDVNYSFTILDANKNLASYDLKLYADLAGSRTDTVDVVVLNSFPSSLNYTASDLATLLGITVDDIGFGDTFYFTASVVTVDGVEYNGAERLDYDDNDTEDPSDFTFTGGGVTNDLLDEAGYRQAFEFDFVILCPSVDLSTLTGTFDVTYDWFFEDDPWQVEVVAGPGANQLTIKDMYGPYTGQMGYDVIIDVNPTTGAISTDKQGVFDTNAFGWGYGECRVETGAGTNYVFSCTGNIALFLQWTVDLGSFGSGPFLLKKAD
ncbi:hypothetical protein [Aestuariibaculum sediminum]|uniref:SusE outer membrane protein domain-containing protein n=1 Tax=Aestuariibaculum sediminum TaxID=2770637 RepID=A0A8J6Q5I0_9FLAO|nr:hypothetical protein [Aestuariibaculum sediminum]MBD0830703.1 hypothetical protein [Aestuariibaculum sediminum]